jgi:uncharacterized protein
MTKNRASSIQRLLAATAIVTAGLVPGLLAAQQPAADPKVLYDLKVPVRDGVKLSVDVYIPPAPGKYPTVFKMTPYGTPRADGPAHSAEEEAKSGGAPGLGARHFTQRGYAYVLADSRGRFDSEGTWYAWSSNEGKDGSDLISWIASQPWSNGKVITMGNSYPAWNQWQMAKERNPHHAAMLSYVAPVDRFTDWPNWNGVVKLQTVVTWMIGGMAGRDDRGAMPFVKWPEVIRHLPLLTLDEKLLGRPLPMYRDMLEHDTLDDYWTRVNVNGHPIDIPTFNVTGWYDTMLRPQISGYLNVMKQTRSPADHFLVIGPWVHAANRRLNFRMRDFGPQATIDLGSMRDRWLDHIMKGAPPSKLPPVQYFLQVKNQWKDASAWPVPGTQFTKYYLASGGKANTLNGDGALRTDRPSGDIADAFTYDPANPVPSTWLSVRSLGMASHEPIDNREVEKRSDVLVYTTEPLREPMEVTGPVTATIYFATDVPDTDITVKLLDVDPQGVAYDLTYGIARARYRDSYKNPTLLKAGQVYGLAVELQPTSNYFEAGHRVRIEVSSSNFPFFSRNLNTGTNSYTTTDMRVAHTRIEHSTAYPSHVVIPIVPVRAAMR